MGHEVDPDTAAAIAEAMAQGLTKRARQKAQEAKRRFKMTNFRPDGSPADRNGQPMMFGEGYGNNMGLDKGKATEWATESEVAAREAEEAADAELKTQRRKEGAAKAKATRAKKKARAQAVKNKIETGDMLAGKRLFFLGWQRKDWDVRIQQLGPLPDGVDVAHSEFGDVLAVPVIESEHAKELKLTSEGGFKDREGREFWVPRDTRSQVERIFGRVMWRQPLTVREAEREFHVRLMK